jgi:hypothetical protein
MKISTTKKHLWFFFKSKSTKILRNIYIKGILTPDGTWDTDEGPVSGSSWLLSQSKTVVSSSHR